MRCILGSLFLVSLQCFSNAEFYSDVDSQAHDEAKALEIKAKDFWQGLMNSAEGLSTNSNAQLCADVDEALKALSPKDPNADVIREHFTGAIDALAKADSMLFEEALLSQNLARQHLEHGPAADASTDEAADWEDVFYNSLSRFIGYRTYENRLAKHIVSRMKDFKSSLERIPDVAPKMLKENSKAHGFAHALLQIHFKSKTRVLPLELQRLCHRIVTATGKQRLRYTTYLLSSVMKSAEDMAGKNDDPSKTVMTASLRGIDSKSTGPGQILPITPPQSALPNEPPVVSLMPEDPEGQHREAPRAPAAPLIIGGSTAAATDGAPLIIGGDSSPLIIGGDSSSMEFQEFQVIDV